MNSLVTVCAFVAAETVNVAVPGVSVPAVPVIAPVLELIDKPVGRAPAEIE